MRRGYADPEVRPPLAVSRIVQAMDDVFVAGLSSAPVARALRSLTARAGEMTRAAGDQARLIGVAQSLREEVDALTAVRRDASRFGEIALAAATQAVLGSGRRAAGASLARTFLAAYMSHLFAHLVGRDISRYVGRGRFASIADAGDFVHAAEAHVTEQMQALELKPELETAEEEGELSQLLAEIVPRALDRLVREAGEDAQ